MYTPCRMGVWCTQIGFLGLVSLPSSIMARATSASMGTTIVFTKPSANVSPRAIPSQQPAIAEVAIVPRFTSKSARLAARSTPGRGSKRLSLKSSSRHLTESPTRATNWTRAPVNVRFLSVSPKGGFRMNSAGQNGERLDPWGSFEPYAQLVRSLLPRATGVVLFDARGEMRWSSETTTGPDLMNLVDDALTAARTEDQSAGQVRMLDDAPVYLFWLRDDRNKLVAIIAIVCRATGTTEADARNLSLVQSLLRPAIECLRRDLLSRAVITDLNRAVTALDKDLELLLTDPSTRSSPGDGADELKGLLQQATEHLRCVMAALIVPDKGIVLMRSEGSKPPDSQLVARTHRQLLSMAQLRREPTIINRLVAGPEQSPVPYRILSCPLQHATGRTMGVLALFRDEGSPEFIERDAKLVDILARKAAGIIESNYDALSGLYTRPAFEQRVRAVVNNPHRTS